MDALTQEPPVAACMSAAIVIAQMPLVVILARTVPVPSVVPAKAAHSRQLLR